MLKNYEQLLLYNKIVTSNRIQSFEKQPFREKATYKSDYDIIINSEVSMLSQINTKASHPIARVQITS